MASSKASNARSSHQEQREQKVLDVMFLCDEWKSSKGGLSTFNREFAINLAEATTGSMKIHCYVSNSDDQDREDAKQHGVNLITARSVPGSVDRLECLKFPPSQLPNPHLVIGHGRRLGFPAHFLARITKCKWIQFVHVYYEDLGKYKESATAAVDTIEENEKKHEMEIELCKAADAVVAVGSRLQQKYSRHLLNVEVKIITPGIFGKFSNESKLAVDRSVVKNFNVSLFGRAAFEDLSLKGYDVVANAIGSLGKNFELTFAGSSPGEQRKVEQWFLDNTCINRNQLTIRRYCSEQEELKVMFYQSDLVALPSRTEGFGLVALEAISAGVPVLVSGESGIAEALQKVEGGNTVIVGSGEDKDEWARRIREMYEESAEEREVNAVKLRENYRKVYSWKEECERFKGLIENVVKTANGGEMNIKVDVNYLKPKEQNMQTGMLATETVRCQEVILPRVSGTSAASGSASCPQTEDLHTRKEEIFLSIILNYFNTINPQSIEEFNRFMEYAEKMRFIITGVSKGSLVMTVRCESLMILEDLWTDYSSGHLDEVVQNCFVTEEILKELNLAELRLKTTIDIEEYNACKVFFEKDALRDALSSEFHSTSSTSESPQKKEQWEKSEQKTKIMETAKLEDQKLNIKVDVEHVKRADQDAYNTASVLALEPAGYQKASTASGTKRKGHSDADLEDPQPIKKKVLCLIAMNYLDTTPAQSRDERNEFKEYLQEMKVFIIGVSVGSLVVTVKCDSLSSLEELWEDYSCGLLDKMVRDCFVTEKILKELNLAELKLKTTMDIGEYNAYKLYFLKKDALRGASSSEFHSISSTSESPQKQEELKKWKQKTKIVETEKLKGMFPLLGSSTSDPEEELEELRMKLQIMKGASSSEFHSISSTSKSPQNQEELKKWKQKTKIVETEKLKGASSSEFHSIHSIGKSPQNQEELKKWKQKTKIVEKLKGMLPLHGSYTSDPEEELEELRMKLQIMKGSFPVLKFSTIVLEDTLGRLCRLLQRLRMDATLPSPALLTAALEEKLKELLKELERQRDKGSLPPNFFTIEVEVDELLKKFPKRRMEGALSSEFHSTSSTSESPLTKEQWEKSEQQTKIMETAKLEGTSPLIVIPTTGHGKELEEPWGRKGMLPLPGSFTFDLEEKLEKLYMKLLTIKGSSSLPVADLEEKLDQVFEEIRMLRMEGNFSVLKLSTIDLEKKLAELGMELHRLRMEGTLPPPELFTADLEDELKQLRRLICILQDRKREKGSSHSLFPIIDTVFRLRRELEKVKVEALENAMYPTIRSGLAKFDVSLPEELQNYVSYLLNESAKLHFRKQVLQSPRALEELRVAMDKDELKAFLTTHIREGAWQVVLLFTDELSISKQPWYCCRVIYNEDEDKEVSNEVIYSSISGILYGWPTEYDPDLITLCKAITNRDWKVTRLILSRSRISDEGLKNLSTALPQSELYSLTLYGNGLQNQGLKHLCEALIISDCHLTSLNVSHNMLGDEEIMHLRDALASVNCRLTTLNVSHNRLGDEGIVLLSNALTSVNCGLTTLNVSENRWGDEGIVYLCNALTSIDCTLTSLNVSNNWLRDEGIMYLCNALTSVNCTLTSLNVSNNWLGDEGIMHLCNALTSVNCRLTSLNASHIRWEDNGFKHLCDALTSSNCVLTKLKIGFIRLGDGGIKELSEVLTNGFCTLTSLDISNNEFGDEGIKHLCKALTDTNCKLRSLDYHGNRNVTDKGRKYLSQMLTGTDWEVRGAQLSRSTTK